MGVIFMSNQFNEGDEIFKNFEITHVRGGENKSGFGVVYIVKNKITGIPLALKTLQNENISINDLNEFKREIYPWIELSEHPNIVSAFTADLDDNRRPYLLMEPILPNEQNHLTLTEYIESEDISEEQVLKWCIQFCNAMEYVNQKGYVHGDVKSDNILISEGIVKITDFGLVQLIDEPTTNEQYNYYLSNDLTDSFDISYDIYSFGIVIYQMINEGKLPLDGANNEEMKIYNETGEFPFINSDLYPIIRKCTQTDSKKRYSSFNELNNDLIKLLYEKYSQKIEKPKLIDFGNIRNSHRGHVAAIFNDIENCKKYYDMAISNSEDEIILFSYALDLIHLREFSEALPYLLRLKENPGILSLDRIYFNIGRCYHEEVCLYKSIEYYKKTIKLNNTFLKAYVNLGNVYKDFGLFEWVLDCYEYVLSYDENFPEALVNIVDLYEKMKDDKNYEKFKSRLDDNIFNPSLKYNVGLFFKEDNVSKFLKSMDEASKTYVSQIPALIKLFEYHLRNDNLLEVNKIFDEIFKLSDDVDLLTDLCFSYKNHGHYTESVVKIDYLYDNLEDNKEYVLLKKSKLIKDNNLNEAIDICKKLVGDEYSDEFKSKVYITLGILYSKINQNDSFNYFLKANSLNPKSIYPSLDLSIHYAKAGEYEIAEGYIDKGLEIDKTQYKLLFNKARLCQDQFKYEEAITYNNKCLMKFPTSDVYGFASYCFIKLDMLEQSAVYLKLAMNISDNEGYLKYLILYLSLLLGLNS